MAEKKSEAELLNWMKYVRETLEGYVGLKMEYEHFEQCCEHVEKLIKNCNLYEPKEGTLAEAIKAYAINQRKVTKYVLGDFAEKISLGIKEYEGIHQIVFIREVLIELCELFNINVEGN